MPTRSTKATVLTKKHIARLERERRQSLIIRWVAIAIAAFVVVGLLVASFLDGTLRFGNFDINSALGSRPVVQLGDETASLHDFQVNVRLQRQGLLNQYATYSQYSQFGLDVSSQLQQIQTQLDDKNTIGQTVVDSLVNDLLIRQEAKKRGFTVNADDVQKQVQAIFGYYPDGSPTPTLTATVPVFPTLSSEQMTLVTLTSTPTLTPEGTLTDTPAPTEPATATPTFTLTPNLTDTVTNTPAESPTPTATAVPTNTSTPTETATPEVTATITPTFTPSPTATPYTLQGFQDTFKQSMDSYSTNLGVTEADYRKLVESELLRQKVLDAVTADVKPVEDQVWARHILVVNEVAALTIRERLLRGEDFAKLASMFSQDTSNKDSGGDLGWFGKGQMVPEFEQAAWSLQIGEISKPVQTQYGWHIIQVLGHEERPLTADQFDQLKQTTFNNWITDARKAAEDAGTLKIFDIWKNYIPTSPSLTDLQQPATGQ